ncbi:MAG: MFS transporter [Hyphomonadaceae bacterium]|nr:MFS transporter [Hyphomonadaceae bacterium]
MVAVQTDDGPPRRAGLGQAAILVVAGFMPIMAIVSLAPAVPSIMARFSDTPNVQLLAPLLVSAPGLMVALLSPVAGLLVDRYGRRPIFIGATAFYALFGIAPYFLDDLRAIFATRLALGITEAAILTIVNTLIADYFDPVARRRVLAAQSVVGPIFGTSVILLSGYLTEQQWNLAFLIYSAAFPIFVLSAFLIFEPRKNAVIEGAASTLQAAALAFPWPDVIKYVAVTFFAANLYYIFIIQAGLAYEEVGVASPAQIGAYISIASVGVPIGGILFGVLGKRSASFLTAAFLFLLGAGMLGIGLARDAQTMLAASFVQQMGAGMTVPTLIYWAQSVLPFELRGRGIGIWCSAFFLGQFTSPFLMQAARLPSGDAVGAFAVSGMIALVGALVGAFVTVTRRRTPASAAAA